MARYALVRAGTVVNVTEWDGDTEKWKPPSGITVVESETAQIGDSYNAGTGVFAPGPAPAPDPLAPKRERLDALRVKGWASLSASEKQEAQQLVFELLRS